MTNRQFIFLLIGAAIIFPFRDDISRSIGRFADPAGAERRDRIEQASRDDTFRTLCPEYFEMSLVGRITSDRRWCDGYRDKI